MPASTRNDDYEPYSDGGRYDSTDDEYRQAIMEARSWGGTHVAHMPSPAEIKRLAAEIRKRSRKIKINR